MKAQKDSFEPGTATLDEFFYWINERNKIWWKRNTGDTKPWSDDPIFQNWKFTNAYRQLDRGTVALRVMLNEGEKLSASLDQIVFNIMWYRLFNLDTHAIQFGFVWDRHLLYSWLREQSQKGCKVFTSAHMTTGVIGEAKVETYIRACEDAWNRRHLIIEACRQGTMEALFEVLLPGYMIGRFVAYEMACDLRFVAGLWPCGSPTDVTTWANMGPGAARGLARLGLMPTLRFTAQAEGLVAMQKLHGMAMAGAVDRSLVPLPFELREIEHSLCEFDKYQRVKRGEGQPRMKFNGRA